jgi:hypothetical protein
VTLDQYLAALVLDRLTSYDLPAVAMQAFAEGFDSLDLAVLASATATESEQASSGLWELWERWLRQSGKALPTRVDAAHTLRDYFAARVCSGSLEPQAGAEAITMLARDLEVELPTREYVGDGLGVARLVGLFYSHDDVPRHDHAAHRAIDDDIRTECRRLLASRTPGGAT